MVPLPLALKRARQRRKNKTIERLLGGIDQTSFFGVLNVVVVVVYLVCKALL